MVIIDGQVYPLIPEAAEQEEAAAEQEVVGEEAAAEQEVDAEEVTTS